VPLRWVILMAWRGAWRTPRRSVLAVLTIAAGLVVLIFLRGVQDGYVAQRIEAVARLGAGHARVVPVGTAYLEPEQRVVERIGRLPGFGAASARLRTEGYLHGPGGAAGAVVIAFLPEKEAGVTDLPKFLQAGGLPPRTRKGEASIALGRGLAARIGAGVGGSVALLVQSALGPPSAERFHVTSIIASGIPALDNHAAILRLPDAQALAGTGAGVSEIAVRLRDVALLPAAIQAWRETGVPGTRLSPWDDQAPEVRQMIEMLRVAERLRGIVVFGLVGLGIANLLSLSVLERRREFGVLLAAGLAPAWLLVGVLIESLAVGGIGVLLGCSLGAGVTGGILARTGIDLSLFGPDLRAALGADPVLYPRVTFANLALASSWVFLVSTLVALPAAWRVLRLDPVEAIRRD